MKQQILVWFLATVLLFTVNGNAQAGEVHVENSLELERAIGKLRPGITLLLEPGIYSGGIYHERRPR